MTKAHSVFIGLGSNLGERADNLRRALGMLPPSAQVEQVSQVYETEPWGYLDQPVFLNQVARVSTTLYPHALLAHLKGIEEMLGRQPSFRNGPRLIDLDVLLFDSLVMDEPGLTIPHPHLAARAFMLVPLNEIAADIIHPQLELSISQLAETSGKKNVKLYEQPPA